MIIEILFDLVLQLVYMMIGLIPEVSFTFPDFSALGEWYGHIAWFFHPGFFSSALAYTIFWQSARLLYAPIKFIIGLIPTINIK